MQHCEFHSFSRNGPTGGTVRVTCACPVYGEGWVAVEGERRRSGTSAPKRWVSRLSATH